MNQQRVRVERIGIEQQPVVVIEDFTPRPDDLIAEAASAPLRTMGEYYPGVRAPVSPAYCVGLAPLLAPIMREVFGAKERITFNRALYSIATTAPTDLSLPQRIPHIDGVEDGMIAIVHYLSRAGFGGTSFYRHRSTGYETIDVSRHRRYLDTLGREFASQGEPTSAYISGDTPLFQRTGGFDAVFNRAILYRGCLLHCADLPNEQRLPADPRSGRLTVASFLSVR